MKFGGRFARVRRVLREDYGVEDTRLHRGGKHPAVIFNHAGRRHRLTLSTTPDPVAEANQLRQTLRAELGPPVRGADGRLKRKMEDMMPDSNLSVLAAKASVPHQSTYMDRRSPVPTFAKAGFYSDGKSKFRLRIHVASLMAWRDVGVAARRSGADTWELWRDTAVQRCWTQGESVGFDKIDLTQKDCVEGLEPFGVSPAEAIEVDGRLLITCPAGTRVAVQRRMPKRATPDVSALIRPADLLVAEVRATHPAEWEDIRSQAKKYPDGPEERMRAVLREITDIEATCRERLRRVRLKDGTECWEWHTEPVRL